MSRECGYVSAKSIKNASQKKSKKFFKKIKKSLKKRLTIGNSLWYYIQAVAARGQARQAEACQNAD